MAWPPPVLPINRTNATPQQDVHPADHNVIAQAMNDTVIKVTGLENSLIASNTDLLAQIAEVRDRAFEQHGGGAGINQRELIVGSGTAMNFINPGGDLTMVPPAPGLGAQLILPAAGVYLITVLINFSAGVPAGTSIACLVSGGGTYIASVGGGNGSGNLTFSASAAAGVALAVQVYNPSLAGLQASGAIQVQWTGPGRA